MIKVPKHSSKVCKSEDFATGAPQLTMKFEITCAPYCPPGPRPTAGVPFIRKRKEINVEKKKRVNDCDSSPGGGLRYFRLISKQKVGQGGGDIDRLLEIRMTSSIHFRLTVAFDAGR
jgi:hypothetical protein